LQIRASKVTPPFTPLIDEVTPPFTPPIEEDTSITDLERKILDMVSHKPKITRQEMVRELNVGIDTVKEYIEKLKNKELLERVGNNRSGYWRIK
jgi:ATP-dependent DNA helicase RecG